MRKGKKWLATAALAAMVGIGFSGVMVNSSFALDPKDDEVQFQVGGNGDCVTNCEAVRVSKQALPSDGMTIKVKDFKNDNNTTGTVEAIRDTIYTDNSSKMKLVFSFLDGKGSFTNPDKVKLIFGPTGGGDRAGFYLKPDSNNPGKLTFEFDNKTLYDAAVDEGAAGNYVNVITNLKYIKLVDTEDNSTLSFNVSGSLNDGDSVVVSMATDINGKTIKNGCDRRTVAIVEDQFVAHTCKCCGGVEKGLDEDLIVLNDEGKLTVKDDESDVVGYSLYNACAGKGGNETCCPEEKETCDLFCNTNVSGDCVLPTICCPKEGCVSGSGLRILQNKDFGTCEEATCKDKYYVGLVASELDSTTLHLVLKADGVNLKEAVDKIEVVNVNDGSVMTTLAIKDSNTAEGDVSNLFKSENLDKNNGIAFRIKITPKEGGDIKPAAFSLSGTLSGGSMENSQSFDWGTIMEWTYGGNVHTYIAPYVRQDSSVTSVIRIENASKEAANVNIYVNDPNGKGWVFVKHLELAPGEVTADGVLTGDKIINYAKDAGITLDGSKGFAVKILSDLGPDKLNVYGSQQMVGAGFRPLSITVE